MYRVRKINMENEASSLQHIERGYDLCGAMERSFGRSRSLTPALASATALRVPAAGNSSRISPLTRFRATCASSRFDPGKNPLLPDVLCRLSKLNGLGKALLPRRSAACHYLGNPQ